MLPQNKQIASNILYISSKFLVNIFIIILKNAYNARIIMGMDIKTMRKKLNMTQTEFGNLFGIPLRTIQTWEYGERKPPDYVLNMIEEILYARGLLK